MLGDRIKKARGKMTQQAVASAVGVTREAVSQWESGITKGLKIPNLFKLAKVLKKNAEWLGTGQGAEEPSTSMISTAESNADYNQLSEEAIKAARAWMKLPPLLQERFLELMIIFNMSGTSRTVTKISEDHALNATTADLLRVLDHFRTPFSIGKK